VIYQCGSGGSGGAPSANGGTGGTTSWNSGAATAGGGGRGQATATSSTGGAAGVGSTYNGGVGGTGGLVVQADCGTGGGGGGGAAGRFGAGRNGGNGFGQTVPNATSMAGGGGGNGGGSAGGNATAGAAGIGGNNSSGVGGGSSGTAGAVGGGGGGGTGSTLAGSGGNGIEFFGVGSGGGMGGTASSEGGSLSGGRFGAGGGGGGVGAASAPRSGGSGSQGAIIIIYEPYVAVRPKHRIANTGNLITNSYLNEIKNEFPVMPDGYYYNYFDGTGDYLTIPSSTAFDFDSGDFTIEGWIRTTSNDEGGVITRRSVDSATWQIYKFQGTLSFYGNGNNQISQNSRIINDGKWHHFAVVRNGNNTTLYVDGIAGTTDTNPYTYDVGTADVWIANDFTAGRDIDCLLSNIRILKGTALYTTDFTPPTSPLTSITNTSLLTCQSSTFIDNSPNNFTITTYGNPTIDGTTPTPFANIPYRYFESPSGISFDYDFIMAKNFDEVSMPNVALRLNKDATVSTNRYFDEYNQFT